MFEISTDTQISGDSEITFLPASNCPPPEPSQTGRVDLTDEYGTLIGYRLISTGEFDQWIENFDTNDRRTSWVHTTSDGYQQNGGCTDVLDDSGERIGERWRIASLSPGGYEDETIEIYDSAGNLLSSTYSNSDGFRSSWVHTPVTEHPHPSGLAVAYGVSYEQYSHDELQYSSTEVYTPEGWLLGSVSTSLDGSRTSYTLFGLQADDGSISGYEGLWEFTGADGSMTTQSDFYDAMLKPVVTYGTGGDVGTSGDPETGKPTDSKIEQNGEVRRDGGEPPLVEEPCIWLPTEEWVVTTEVEPEPRIIICEPSPFESGVLKSFELEALAPSEVPQQSEPDPSISADGGETDGNWVGEPVMQITGSPVTVTAPPPSVGSTTVRSARENLKLSALRVPGARHGELTGDRDLNLTGNRFGNVLMGNAGDNRIAGGRGIDQCSGGAGGDGFVLIAKRGFHDWLTDFNPEEDHLLLAKGMRRLFKGGELREGVIGDRLIWDDANKTLLCDPDGNSGTRDPITLAIIPGLEAQAVTEDLFMPG